MSIFDGTPIWLLNCWVTTFQFSIFIVPPFPELKRFLDGHGFTQWTRNDSKALMKVSLSDLLSPSLTSKTIGLSPAIEGHVPSDIVQTIWAFLEFCYIVQHNVINKKFLDRLRDTLTCFHWYWEIFQDVGVCADFSLLHQHFLIHYESLIQLFGALNGVSISITESKHIITVKKPWCHSSKNNALTQILQTNQHLLQLAAAHADFEAHGMLTVQHDGMYWQYLHIIYSLTANFYSHYWCPAEFRCDPAHSAPNTRGGCGAEWRWACQCGAWISQTSSFRC